MNDDYRDILYRVAEETFETLAFMFIAPEDRENTSDYSSGSGATISFSGLFSGKLVLKISDQVLPELTENMLGIEKETAVSQRHDALKEVLNVICGNVLPAIAGNEAIFELDMPKILAKEESCKFAVGEKPTAMTEFELDDGHGELLLFIDGQVPGK